ncbi:MAG: hypothetical protein ACRC33_03395, partial [Gemmataceae bacterium]
VLQGHDTAPPAARQRIAVGEPNPVTLVRQARRLVASSPACRRACVPGTRAGPGLSFGPLVRPGRGAFSALPSGDALFWLAHTWGQRSRLGAPEAVTAAAHELARVAYHLMRYGGAYVKRTEEAYAREVRERQERQLARRAKEMGYELTKIEADAPPAG